MMRLFGTSYLDLQTHPAYLKMVEHNLRRYGLNNPLSRSNAGQFEPLEAVEHLLAEDLRTEDAVLLPSGFAAGQCLAELATQRRRNGEKVIVSKEGHLSYRSMLSGELIRKMDTPEDYGILLDAVDSFSGFCDWVASPETVSMIEGAQWSAVDVSHSYGLWECALFLERWPGKPESSVYFGSLGKAAAFPAGFVAGPADFLEPIRRMPVYTAAAPPANAMASAFIEAKGLRSNQRERLYEIIATVRDALGLAKQPLPFPALLCGEQPEEVYDAFIAADMAVAYLSYPTAIHPRVLRIVMNAGLNPAELRKIPELYRALNLAEPPRAPAQWMVL